MKTRIIAFTGRKGSGKNESANAMFSACGDDFAINFFAFANELKAIARRLYGLNHEQTNGSLKEVVVDHWGLTPREIMQRLGTEVARSIHPDTWVRATMGAIREWMDKLSVSKSATAVITDCRYPNEVAAVKAAGGIVIRVVRPGLALNEYSNHPSETGIDTLPVDYEIVNDGTIEDLHRKVREIVGV